jgi:hypothetical protein
MNRPAHLVTNWVDRAAPGLTPVNIEAPAAAPAEQEDQSAEIERQLRMLR